MDKVLLLKLCVYINLATMVIFSSLLFMFNEYDSSYFQIGWSKDFIFVSIEIDTPLRYLLLCTFIIVFNISENKLINIKVFGHFKP